MGLKSEKTRSSLRNVQVGDAVPDSGGAHQWSADGGSGDLTDSIGSLTGVKNGWTWTSGAGTGNTYPLYDGADDYTDLGSNSQSEYAHIVNTNTFTLFAVVKPENISGDEVIIGTDANGPGFLFRFNSSDINYFVTSLNAGADNVDASSADIVNNEWQVVAITGDNTDYNFYHRSLEDNSDTLDNIGTSSVSRSTSSDGLNDNVSFGRSTGTNDRYFQGGIDYVFTDTSARQQSALSSIANDLEQFYP